MCSIILNVRNLKFSPSHSLLLKQCFRVLKAVFFELYGSFLSCHKESWIKYNNKNTWKEIENLAIHCKLSIMVMLGKSDLNVLTTRKVTEQNMLEDPYGTISHKKKPREPSYNSSYGMKSPEYGSRISSYGIITPSYCSINPFCGSRRPHYGYRNSSYSTGNIGFKRSSCYGARSLD